MSAGITAIDAITIAESHDVTGAEVQALFVAVGWTERAASSERLGAMLSGSTVVVTARSEGKLVGIARAISDGVFNAYVSTVAVHPEWQRRGIGRAMMERMMHGHDGIKFVLNASDQGRP